MAIILIIAGLGLAGWGIFNYFQSQRPNAGLKVETNPPALVFVDNVQIGQSPVEKIFKPGEVSLKIIPGPSASALTTYQTTVRLTSKVYTVVRRDFGPTDVDTAGETVTLEPQSGKSAGLSVVTSSPDSAAVIIDGQPQGFSPVLISEIEPGDHQITLSAPGFVSRTISAKAVAGYKLVISAKLAGQVVVVPTIAPTPVPSTGSGLLSTKVTPTVAPIAKPYVEIQDTPTGFLRVRSAPNTGGTELTQVKPGERFGFLGEQSGWYQIKLNIAATTSGWISAQYADKVE